MKIGISEKIILLFILLVIILGIALGFYSIKHQNETLLFEYDEKVRVLLDSSAVSSEYPVLVGNKEALYRIGNGILKHKDVIFCEIRNTEGKILYKSGSKEEKYSREYTLPILTEVVKESTGEELILGFKEKETKEIGRIYLVLSLSDLMKKSNEAKKTMGALFIFGIVLSSIFITILVRFILSRPIDELIKGIERISGGELKYKVPLKSNDEIGKLAGSFNKMAEDLSKTLVSKDYVDNIFSSMIDSLIVTDAAGKIKTVNPATLYLLSYKEEEIIGQPFDMLLTQEKKDEHPMDETPFFEKNIFKNLIRNGILSNFKMTYFTKNNKKIPVIFSGSVIKNREGKITNIVCVAKDITTLVKTEEALRESEEKYRSLTNQLPIGLYRITKEGKFLHANPALAKILEHESVEELTKISSEELYKDPNERIKQLAQWNTSKGVVCNEREFHTKKGRQIWIRDTWRAILDGNGEINCITGTIEDITEHKQAIEALKFEKAYLDRLFESAQEAIVMTDSEGRIIRVNSEFTRLFGYSSDKAVGELIDKLVVNKDLMKEATSYTRQLAEGKKVSFESVRQRKDGTLIHVSAIGSPIILENEQVGIYYIFRDITKRKRAEKELQSTMEKLRKSMRGTIQAVALTVETKDPYVAGHQQRVADLARSIAKEIGLTKNQIDGIRMAGLIHDIGKISVPAEILSKPSRLTKLEFAMIKAHPQVGYNILKQIAFPWPVAKIVLQHHERLNGSGYPLGLSGEKIVMEARILGVADVVEAMASYRPYRPALGIDMALEEISKNRGTLYDPKVVDVCVKLFKEKGFKFRLKEKFRSLS